MKEYIQEAINYSIEQVKSSYSGGFEQPQRHLFILILNPYGIENSFRFKDILHYHNDYDIDIYSYNITYGEYYYTSNELYKVIDVINIQNPRVKILIIEK